MFLYVEDVFDVLVFPCCLRERLVETECSLKTTTVILKLGVIKLLYTLKLNFSSHVSVIKIGFEWSVCC